MSFREKIQKYLKNSREQLETHAIALCMFYQVYVF